MMNIIEIIELLKKKYGDINSRQINKDYWKFEILTKEGRSQLIHLFFKEIKKDDIDESRIIIESPIGPLHKNINYEILLRRNAKLDIGAVCIEDLRNDSNLVVPYLTLRATHLTPTADNYEVIELAEKIARNADELEKEIFARDIH